jgi:hypothetical protein
MCREELHVSLMATGFLLAACGGAADDPGSSGLENPSSFAPISVSSASPFAPDCLPSTIAPFGERIVDAEMETHLAVNPRDPDNIVVAWMQDLFTGLVVATTQDGGTHWTVVPVPGTSRCSGGDMDIAADPWLSFAPDGTLYLSGFSLDLPVSAAPLPFRTRLFATTSTDGGRSWAAPVQVTGGYSSLHDKPAIVADPSRPCTAYVAWTEETTAFGPVSTGLDFSRTTDCGRTWSAPVIVFEPLLVPITPFTIAHGSQVLVLPDGTVVVIATQLSSLLSVAYPELPDPTPPRIIAFRSADQGSSWSMPVVVADLANGPFHDPETDEKVLASGFLVAAAATPSGAIYVAYRNQLSNAVAEIRVAKSIDGGSTWLPSSLVRNADTQMMYPQVATGPDGSIAVTYYDIRNDALADETLTTDFWLSRSTDGGASWREMDVAGPFDLRSAAYMSIPSEGLDVGEYTGLASLPGGFAAAFAQATPQAAIGASDIFFVRLRDADLP